MMNKEEIVKAISDDKMMPFIQPEQLAEIVNFVIKNYKPSLPSNLDEAANRQAALEQPYKWEEEQDGSFGVTPLFVISNIRSAFIAGAEWQKEQMTKEAVAVEVVGEKRDLRLIDSTQRCLFNAKRGDWLRIIIVKEDEI